MYCWLSTSTPPSRPNYALPGATKKGVLPSSAVREADQARQSGQAQQDRAKRFRDSRAKSGSKDSPDKDKDKPDTSAAGQAGKSRSKSTNPKPESPEKDKSDKSKSKSSSKPSKTGEPSGGK